MLDSDDIQGNIVPGFLKPFQRLIGLSIVEVPSAQAWLRQLAPRLTTLRQAMQTREEVRRHRGMRRALTEELNPVPGSVDDAWINIAFSYRGLRKLFAADEDREAQLKQFQDEAFPLGLAARSAALGDPTDPHLPGHPQNWRVGGVSGEPDILLIFAADRYERLDELSSSIGSDGLQHVYEENARKLDPRGAEHFGFKDGVSQPGVRGRYSDEADAFVTQRVVAPDGNRQSLLYGLPGQRLIWPGEFIFGYPRQCADPLIPGPANLPGPDWSRNGSYLVFRRLQQDVQGFREFLRDQAETLRAQQRMSEMTTERLAAYLFGRWPSGAPVARSEDADDATLGADRLENNYFEFGADADALSLTDSGSTDRFPSAAADPLGLVCPLSAHIRKVNSRMAANDQGGARASYTRRILRRGLPYGEPYSDETPDSDRGLLFLSYQASIVDQFEFLASWMNSPTGPRSPSGHDLVVGQNGQPGERRKRKAQIIRGNGTSGTITTERDFVTPTGGGYFFSPSVSAVRDVIAGQV